MPRCGPQLDGQVFCKFGAIYECQFVDPNGMDRRTGWRWKSDLLRSCDEPVPVTTGQPDGLPPGFSYAPQIGNGSQPGSGNLLANPDANPAPEEPQPNGPTWLVPRNQSPSYPAFRRY